MAERSGRWTRRSVLGALAATAGAGCGLAGGEAPPAPAPTPVPAPAPERERGKGKGKGKTARGGGQRSAPEPGTLFRPTSDAELPKIAWVNTPAWFRDAGGLFCPAPRTAGSALLLFTEKGKWALSNRIRHFRELPSLLERGRKLGTDVLYLIDYYEGLPGASPTEYCWNKGEYVPRADLGGEKGLIEGIRAVHAAGGRVILYLEPFVIAREGALGKRVGQKWSIRTADGYPDDPYPDAWKLCPHEREVVEHLAAVATRLVGYGADGLHLDSYGYQRGWKCVESKHGHGSAGDGDAFDEGAKALVERLHAAITRVNPQAVLMCEGPKHPALFRWASASQDWGVHTVAERWLWRASGRIPAFTSGWNLDDMNQIVAMGHRLSLGAEYWLEPPPGPTLARWLDANLPRPIPDQKDERFRRFFAEDYFRSIHAHRNAGLLHGRPMPNIDRIAPRRWDGAESFTSHAGLTALLEGLAAEAPGIDAALDGVALAPPDAYIGGLVRARAKLAPVLDGSTVALDPPERTGPHALAYRFTGPNGAAYTAVNVDNTSVSLDLPREGRYEELLTGERAEGGARFEVPAHAVRLWVRRKG